MSVTEAAEPSPRILIIADDLTGGNACGALFAEAGLKTMTVTGADDQSSLGAALDAYDAIVVNANSRHLPSAEAAAITASIVAAAGDVDLLACRIDTTLRGNVGATAEAALRARAILVSAGGSGSEDVAAAPTRVLGLCVPAFPSSGRVTVGGRQLLNGRLLEDTELAHDVRSPMTTSEVATILASGTGLTCHTIDISTVLAGSEAIRAEVLSGIVSGADVIVADALTLDHIDRITAVIADLTREAAETGSELLDWVAIDPGPGSMSLARAFLPTRPRSILLGVSGSATEVTRTQLAALAEDPDIHVMRVEIDAEGLPDVEATVRAVCQVASARAIVIATVLDAYDLRELTAEASELIPRRLAMITAEVMERVDVAGLYSTGGDVTAAVLSGLDALGMEIDAEIIPLAVGGRIAGGRAAGLPIVTKGGLIGDAGTAALCFDHLNHAARSRG
ncbi:MULTISPECIES: four-carbon acid sugar kinase family protein [unclassified Brevibacterium]|uniref:four-carbon acid sugar kinase family protein n=1 Tax=unclassified Brevibacterium TaxID=2614124 RepID=UPI0010919320|nr:four-carbon acid sugar kinase family protein [Brevibacterium sp. S22]TGD33249.1 four-carbon acid sugar kinase family protein [Brevibacterium sp. S22]